MIPKQNLKLIEGSRAIAEVVRNIGPAVVSAYPITPQTHIVEALAKFQADGEASYEYLRAESEFAAASIILGASATGVRVYSATSSQGLLLMTEVIFNIAGMRLPIVMTDANRSISGPINIWNDQQDIMVVKDSGWILMFAENSQEAVDQHIIAYKVAEQKSLPVMVNVDGFVLTHLYEPVYIPEKDLIKKYLPEYQPTAGTYLNPDNPITMGAFVYPNFYTEMRQKLHSDLLESIDLIDKEYTNYLKIVYNRRPAKDDSGLLEYTGPKNPKKIIVAMGSVIGTIKEAVQDYDNFKNTGVLKIKVYRPFPAKAILKILSRTKKVAVIEKSLSLGYASPLYTDIKASAYGQIKVDFKNYVVGLGGRDIKKSDIRKIIKD